MTIEQAAAKHASAIRRCLLTCDVVGLTAIWNEIAPHMVQRDPAQNMISLHMARVEMKNMPVKLKQYSIDWLKERGYKKLDGKWVHGAVKEVEVFEAAAIASRSRIPGVAERIQNAMSDAYMNARAKGITEPEWQRELMQKARAKERFKLRMA